MSPTQVSQESGLPIQRPLEGKSSTASTELPPKCQKWMHELWMNLNAKFEAHNTYTDMTRSEILGKHTGRIQRKLREKLAEKKSSLTMLVEYCPRMYRRDRAYRERVMRLRKKPLAMVPEDSAAEPKIPKMPRLSKTGPLGSWVKESLQVYGTYIASDSVDGSIKPRLMKIRRCLRLYFRTGKAIGIATANGNRPNRSDLQSLSTEVAVMLAITSKINVYTQILDDPSIDASFRPRVVEVVGMLKSYQKSNFRIGLDSTLLSQFENELQDLRKARAQGRAC